MPRNSCASFKTFDFTQSADCCLEGQILLPCATVSSQGFGDSKAESNSGSFQLCVCTQGLSADLSSSLVQHPLPAQEEVESLRLALADSEALLEERSLAMSSAHAQLEDKHKDTLFGLRQTQDKVSFCPAALSWDVLTGCVAWTDWQMGMGGSASAFTVCVGLRSLISEQHVLAQRLDRVSVWRYRPRALTLPYKPALKMDPPEVLAICKR